MKPRSELGNQTYLKEWLTRVIWTLLVVTAVPLLYTTGAVAGRVCFLKGLLPEGSRRLALVETVFKPIDYPYSHNRAFRSVYDKCVAVFVDKHKIEK